MPMQDNPFVVQEIEGHKNPFWSERELQALANDTDRLVLLAVRDEGVLESVRATRKIYAIKRLREIGLLVAGAHKAWPSLLTAKSVIEGIEVKRAADLGRVAPRPPVEVHIVKDISGERLEVFSWKPDAEERVRVLNIEEGQGYAFYDSHALLARGQQPE